MVPVRERDVVPRARLAGQAGARPVENRWVGRRSPNRIENQGRAKRGPVDDRHAACEGGSGAPPLRPECRCAAPEAAGPPRPRRRGRRAAGQRAAGVPEPAPGQLRHRRPARRHERGEREGDLVAHPAGAVLVDQGGARRRRARAPRRSRSSPGSSGWSRPRPSRSAGSPSPGRPSARRRHRRGYRRRHPVDLLIGQPPAIPLGDDHVDGADPHRSLAHGATVVRPRSTPTHPARPPESRRRNARLTGAKRPTHQAKRPHPATSAGSPLTLALLDGEGGMMATLC